MGSPIACPQCGYTQPTYVQKSSEFSTQVSSISAFKPSDARTYMANDESRLLCQEISELDDAIRRLYEERAARCRRLNEIQSPIANLPSIILSEIFQYVCPPWEYNSAHQRIRRTNAKPLVLPIFALCAVSFRWRQLILSMPKLWARLDWHWKYHLSHDDTAALLRTYFLRSGSIPLDLKLTIDEKWEIENTIPYNDPEHLDGHMDAIKRTIFFENGKKVGSLKLDAPIRWLNFISKTFTHLTDLSLRSERIDTCIDLSELSSLSRITLMNVRVTPSLPWKRISTINLVCARIDVAFELLRRCPNLSEFHSQHPNPVKNSSITQTLTDAITIPHLTWLNWSCLGSLWDDALFRFMHFPALRRLSLTGDASWNSDWENTLTNFLTWQIPASPPIDLDLGYIRDFTGGPLPVLKTIFHSLGTSLQNLTVLQDDHAYLDKIISLLTPSSSNEEPIIYLPSLRRLSIKSPDREYAKDHGVFTRLRGAPQQLPGIVYGDTFVELLRQRRKVLHLSEFCLDLNFKPGWKLRSRDELEKLVEEGFELEVIEMGEKVSWLSHVVLAVD